MISKLWSVFNLEVLAIYKIIKIFCNTHNLVRQCKRPVLASKLTRTRFSPAILFIDTSVYITEVVINRHVG